MKAECRRSHLSELDRARSRDDVEVLLCDLEDFRRYNRDVQGLEEYVRTPSGNHNYVWDADREDPDKGLAYLALAMATYEDVGLLGQLAAGLLEDLLRDPTPDILSRIIDEARNTARFRWMLSGVWLHAIAERAREPVANAVGDFHLEMPLPARPA